MDSTEFIKSLGLGLSRALRYSFGGVLIISIVGVVKPHFLMRATDAVGWQIIVLSALLLGTGWYALHRAIVIPIHHFTGIILLNSGEALMYIFRGRDGGFLDRLFRLLRRKYKDLPDPREYSLSPTRWLALHHIPYFRRMIAYGRLRVEFFSEEERDAINVIHAEHGLSVMISEGLFALAGYYLIHPVCCGNPSGLYSTLAVVLFVISALSGIQQHRVECAQFKEESRRSLKIVNSLRIVPDVNP